MLTLTSENSEKNANSLDLKNNSIAWMNDNLNFVGPRGRALLENKIKGQ